MITSHLMDFDSHPVWVYMPDNPSPPPLAHAVRIGVGPGRGLDVLLDELSSFAAQPAAADIPGLVIGGWDGMADQDVGPVVDWLVANAHRFPVLAAIFVSDVSHNECPLPRIRQCDPAPLFAAYPHLRLVGVRGATAVQPFAAPDLGRLVLQTVGLPREAVDGIARSELPAIEELELWLGWLEGGRTTGVDDLRPLFTEPPATLRVLRLRNADGVDELVEALADAPVLSQLHTLDLSMGTLTDGGASSLAADSRIGDLTCLDLSGNYLSVAAVAELKAIGLPVEAASQRQPEVVDGAIRLAPAVID